MSRAEWRPPCLLPPLSAPLGCRIQREQRKCDQAVCQLLRLSPCLSVSVPVPWSVSLSHCPPVRSTVDQFVKRRVDCVSHFGRGTMAAAAAAAASKHIAIVPPPLHFSLSSSSTLFLSLSVALRLSLSRHVSSRLSRLGRLSPLLFLAIVSAALWLPLLQHLNDSRWSCQSHG